MTDQLERDLRVFADPATDVIADSNRLTTRLCITRDGSNLQILQDLASGQIRVTSEDENTLVERIFPNTRSMLSSSYFADIQVLANNQRRLIAAQNHGLFIEPEGVIDGEALTQASFHRAATLTEDKQRLKPIEILLLDGSAGVGKTSLISQLVMSRATGYGRESIEPPVLHVANRGRRLVSLDELIALSIQLVRGKFTYDQVPALIRNGALQIAIDGFDELVDADGYADTWSVLREFLKDIGEGGPIILAGRDTFFDLTKFKERLMDVGEDVAMHHASLSPISPSTAKTWLLEVGWSREDLNTPEAEELLKPDSYVLRPYFLSTIAPLGGVDSVLQDLGNPREFLVTSFIEREANLITQRVNLTKEIAASLLRKLFELIALEMAEAETEAVDLPFLQLAVDLIFEKALPDPADMAKLRHKAGSFALMDLDARQGFRRFPHTEISNHFLANALLNEMLEGRMPRFLRRGYFGTDFLTVLGDQILDLSSAGLHSLRNYLYNLLRNDAGSERLSENVASILLSSIVADNNQAVLVSHTSAGDVVLFGTTGPAHLNDVIVNRLDCRSANLCNIIFNQCSASVIVVDDATIFGSTAPLAASMMIEADGRTSALYSPSDIQMWIDDHSIDKVWEIVDNNAVRILERVCRVFLRQFFIKSDPLDPGGRYLSDPLWPSIEEELVSANRLRRTDRKDASGKRADFVHIINPAALLDRSSDEDRAIWQAISKLGDDSS